MSRILVVADASWVRNDVHAALSIGDVELIDHTDPETAAATAVDQEVDAVVVDLQIAAMGGMAVTRSIRATDTEERSIPVVMLLDRQADTFLAGRAGASAWVVKPFSARDLRDALATAAPAPA